MTLSSVVLLTVAVLVLLASTPLVFPRSPSDADARADAAARGVPLIYWRPGCTFCIRMRLALGTRGSQAVWMNVRRDSAASARVRSVNDGNETVPTVFVDAQRHRTNPSPQWVREHLVRPR